MFRAVSDFLTDVIQKVNMSAESVVEFDSDR